MVYVGFEMLKCVLSDDSRLIIWPILFYIDLLCLPCKIIFIFSFINQKKIGRCQKFMYVTLISWIDFYRILIICNLSVSLKTIYLVFIVLIFSQFIHNNHEENKSTLNT